MAGLLCLQEHIARKHTKLDIEYGSTCSLYVAIQSLGQKLWGGDNCVEAHECWPCSIFKGTEDLVWILNKINKRNTNSTIYYISSFF